MDRMDMIKNFPKKSTCPRCGTANQCAMEAGKSASTCWCMEFDAAAQLELREGEEGRCLCRSCLREAGA